MIWEVQFAESLGGGASKDRRSFFSCKNMRLATQLPALIEVFHLHSWAVGVVLVQYVGIHHTNVHEEVEKMMPPLFGSSAAGVHSLSGIG